MLACAQAHLVNPKTGKALGTAPTADRGGYSDDQNARLKSHSVSSVNRGAASYGFGVRRVTPGCLCVITNSHSKPLHRTWLRIAIALGGATIASRGLTCRRWTSAGARPRSAFAGPTKLLTTSSEKHCLRSRDCGRRWSHPAPNRMEWTGLLRSQGFQRRQSRSSGPRSDTTLDAYGLL